MACMFYNSNYVVRWEGKLSPVSSREGQEITISTNGVKKISWIRNIRNFNVQVDEMTQENYDKLMDLHESGENFVVVDTIKKIEVGDYLFPSSSFSLPDTEDKKLQRFIYSGNFTVEKV